jgi:hypothetical protein
MPEREKERMRKNQDSNLTHTHRLAYTLANRLDSGYSFTEMLLLKPAKQKTSNAGSFSK